MMRAVVMFLACIFLLTGAASGEGAPLAGTDIFRVGVSVKSLATINRNDGQAAVRVWVASVAREYGLAGQWDVVLFDSVTDMKHAVQGGQISAMQMLTSEFVDFGVIPEAVYLQITADGAEVRYVLLAHSDGGLRDFGAISPGEVLLHRGIRMELAPQWLDTLFAQRSGGAADLRVRTTESASKAILEVFFRQTRLSVVTREAFDLATELNPQLRRDLTILAESPPLVTTLFFVHPDWNSLLRASVEHAVENLHTTAAGKQVLLVFQGERMEKHPVSVLDDTLSFLRSHRLISGEEAR